MKDTDIHIRATSILKQKLKEEADKQERSQSWVVVKALEQYLKGEDR